MKKNERYKYRLLALLRTLSVEDYEIAMKFFPEKLNIHSDTWRAWIYTTAGEKREIPARALLTIAAFFDCAPEQLYTEPPALSQFLDSWQDRKTNTH